MFATILGFFSFLKSYLWYIGVHLGSWNIPLKVHFVTETTLLLPFLCSWLYYLTSLYGMIQSERWNCTQCSCLSLCMM